MMLKPLLGHINRRRGTGGRGGAGVVCRDYRWAASIDLKQSRDLAATISWGRLFHSGMVLGKNAMAVMYPTRGDVVAVCVVLSVARSVFCWLW